MRFFLVFRNEVDWQLIWQVVGECMLKVVRNFAKKLARNSGAGVAALLATLVDYLQYQSRLPKVCSFLVSDYDGLGYLQKMQTDGICIVENFWSDEMCIAARNEVDRIIREYPHALHSSAKSDQRVYGANNVSHLIESFAENSKIHDVASAYNQELTRTAFTLAARMPSSKDNQGSGEGWHRDAFLRQFKAILYLSDVGPENGPFQFIKYSHRPRQLLKDIWKGKLCYMQYRLSETEVSRIIEGSSERLVTYAAKAGTLIIVDTSAIHRGMPIQTGTRYALTNYYFPVQHIDKAMFEKFKVLEVVAK